MTSATLILAVALAAQPGAHDQHHAEVNRRGEAVMGFDQTLTAHHFRLTANGGSIEVTAKRDGDTTLVEQIRLHLRHIAKMFADGNFTAPMLIHGVEPPGVKTMKLAGAGISYTYVELERGGVVRIATTNASARNAIHDFLRFQIADHGTGDPLRVGPR